ncbi:hypothetical protein [Natronobacterium texcoconense]|uniref:Uncharacterized protein n=1 Tax=Natronobacterium texcoconense TaxID=1095778 RepID=A0A1H1IWU9_NATTX|nr:hypothetical protein [Natronobacterium texcoconense]SDR42182.1 hypothetical protein SAMN04489842_3869 [Natronobacterium texcoconense]
MLPESPRDRLEWAITESVVIFGILLFWVGVAAVVTIVARLLTLPLELLDIHLLLLHAEFGRAITGLWGVVVPLTIVTATLYVIVRAGGLLIDYYRREPQRQ